MLEVIKLLRDEKRISQKKLADEIGMSQQSINAYENTKVEPDIQTLIKIADYFESSIDFIAGNTSLRFKIEKTTEHSLNEEEKSIILGYRKLTKSSRKIVRELILEILSK